MRNRFLGLALLALMAAADLRLSRDAGLIRRAGRESVPDRRISVLERGSRLTPGRDEADRQLGRAYFARALERLTAPESRDRDLRRSEAAFRRSLAANPFSAAAHFDFAQALRYIDLLHPVPAPRYRAEFMAAARLADFNADLYYQTGKILFADWPSLSADERSFLLGMLPRIFAREIEGRVREFVEIWDLNVRDYEVIQAILPKNAVSDRIFAGYLGERGLSREERLQRLARAETAELAEARDLASAAEADLRLFRLAEAAGSFNGALAKLDGILVYQALRGRQDFDPAEIPALRRAVLLGLAKCRIEQTGKLAESYDRLEAYLEVEDDAAAVTELARYLTDHGLLGDRPASADVRRRLFELKLAYKQNRFREVTDLGRPFLAESRDVAGAGRPAVAEILRLVGAAYQKLDFPYESTEAYRRALAVGGPDAGTLFQIRKNLLRLNDQKGLRGLAAEIAAVVAPRDSRREIAAAKGVAADIPLVLEGGGIRLTLRLAEVPDNPPPYVSVVFNGWIAWEDFVRGGKVDLELASREGGNLLRLVPLNESVMISGIFYDQRTAENRENIGLDTDQGRVYHTVGSKEKAYVGQK